MNGPRLKRFSLFLTSLFLTRAGFRTKRLNPAGLRVVCREKAHTASSATRFARGVVALTVEGYWGRGTSYCLLHPACTGMLMAMPVEC